MDNSIFCLSFFFSVYALFFLISFLFGGLFFHLFTISFYSQMIHFFTMALGGEGYLNFMGNEVLLTALDFCDNYYSY